MDGRVALEGDRAAFDAYVDLVLERPECRDKQIGDCRLRTDRKSKRLVCGNSSLESGGLADRDARCGVR